MSIVNISSGNLDNFIDDNLRKILVENEHRLSWIPPYQLKNIVPIGGGGFATVYSADWIDESQAVNNRVAMKVLNGSDKAFIKELKANCELGCENSFILRCYGVSKFNQKHCLILKYAKSGTLYDNLHLITKMNWKEKFNLLKCIAQGLKIIHFKGYIHSDVHSKNIFLDDAKAYIGDFGNSVLTNEIHEEIYGVFSYMAPEILVGEKFTEASDVYSFGVIMAELSTGQSPFDNPINIIDRKQSIFAEGTPESYIRLAKRCMHPDPQERPTARYISEYLAHDASI
ncbi:kinase-like domain-containing protein [Gigaspora rosea]|uniref:Kinase-like domain-containing protein n=1 Tax=Gigaspora rosea TaxID=44941 RepID=A0A397VKQ9_9GLOM|nr:kinase-like domain-containing protein [Gigaspora rosea]